MSSFRATVRDIQGHEGVHIVECQYHDSAIYLMSLALDSTIMLGSDVVLLINPTQVSIARENHHDNSDCNHLPVTIESVTHGRLLSTLTLRYHEATLESIISYKSAIRMGLKEGDKVLALIKASEISIEKVYDV